MKTNQTLGLMFASLLCVRVHAQSAVTEFVPFQQFMEHTRTANARDLARPGNGNNEDLALEQMRQHLLTRYAGVQVSHSFVRGSSHFDCIPTLQQPGARALGLSRTAPAPPESLLARPTAGNDPAAEGPTTPASLVDPATASDEFGNSLHCEAGTIPMRRTTLEQLAQFPTLREFFQKGPRWGRTGTAIGSGPWLRPRT